MQNFQEETSRENCLFTFSLLNGIAKRIDFITLQRDVFKNKKIRKELIDDWQNDLSSKLLFTLT